MAKNVLQTYSHSLKIFPRFECQFLLEYYTPKSQTFRQLLSFTQIAQILQIFLIGPCVVRPIQFFKFLEKLIKQILFN